MRCLWLLALALVVCPVHAALNPVEGRMVAAVERDSGWSLALLERLVNINSGTRNLAGVAEVGRALAPELEHLGFQVVWKPMRDTGRAGHLIATHPGRPGTRRLLLIGHLDTVFEPDSPFQSYVRHGHRASGPGVGDDKGGDVVMLLALRAMQAAGSLRDANVEVMLTGDEESAGSPQSLARADLVAAGRRADVALDFEGLVVLDGQDMGSVARRSASAYVITTHGTTGHSSGIFSADVGDGAIFELARILCAFRSELPEPGLTFNIGVVAGGARAAFSADESTATAAGKTNISPGVAVANGDFRALEPAQVERVQARMTAIVARHLPHTSAEIVFTEGYPPMAPTAGNRALLARLNEVNAALGYPPMPALDPLKRGAGDISFVAADVDGLAGLGPASEGDHTPDESVDLDSIPRQAARAALLMTRLSREPAPARGR